MKYIYHHVCFISVLLFFMVVVGSNWVVFGSNILQCHQGVTNFLLLLTKEYKSLVTRLGGFLILFIHIHEPLPSIYTSQMSAIDILDYTFYKCIEASTYKTLAHLLMELSSLLITISDFVNDSARNLWACASFQFIYAPLNVDLHSPNFKRVFLLLFKVVSKKFFINKSVLLISTILIFVPARSNCFI